MNANVIPPNPNAMSPRRRRMRGGSDESLPQGRQFLNSYPTQRQAGGAYTALVGAPVVAGDQGLLEGGLRGMARVDGLDASMQATRGMSDQSGGRRRSRKNVRRSRGNMRRSRGNMRRSRGNVAARRSRNNVAMRRSRNNVAMRRSRNNGAARRSRNNVAMRRSRNNGAARRSRNNVAMRRSRNNVAMRRSRSRNNVAMRRSRSRNNVAARRGRMYGGAASYAGAPYGQSPMLLDSSAAAKAGTADFSDPFAKGSA